MARGYAVLANNEREDHTRIRRNAQEAFRPTRFFSLEPYIRQLVNDAIDSFEQDKRADLVRQMVYELPALILLKLLGIPEEDVQRIKMWADSRLILSFGKPSVQEQLIAAGHLADYWDYCLAHVQKRIADPQDDLPSDMLATRAGDDSILTIEDINNVFFACCWQATKPRLICRPTLSSRYCRTAQVGRLSSTIRSSSPMQ